jgi:hypothetical protein
VKAVDVLLSAVRSFGFDAIHILDRPIGLSGQLWILQPPTKLPENSPTRRRLVERPALRLNARLVCDDRDNAALTLVIDKA